MNVEKGIKWVSEKRVRFIEKRKTERFILVLI